MPVPPCPGLFIFYFPSSHVIILLPRGKSLFGIYGKTVRIRYGPAAVTGDECRNNHCPRRWEGAACRTIRKSEDLPTL
jgi:hypothetical protein